MFAKYKKFQSRQKNTFDHPRRLKSGVPPGEVL